MADRDNPEGEVAQAKQAKKNGFGGMSTMIVVVAAVVLASALSAFLAVTILGKGAVQKAEQGQAEEHKEEKKELGPTMDLGSFTVNLAGQSGVGFVKAGVALELAEEKLAEELAGREPMLKDVVITALGERTMAEISTPQGRDDVKKRIVEMANKAIGKGKVSNVFFTEFVFQ